jgi:outer membrane lipopolysaccharide assembly protein LptE/RlpB
MKRINVLLLIAATAVLSSCNYQKNNTIKQDDVNEGNERIYGDGPEAPARQLAKQFEATPEDVARAAKIKETLYGK